MRHACQGFHCSQYSSEAKFLLIQTPIAQIGLFSFCPTTGAFSDDHLIGAWFQSFECDISLFILSVRTRNDDFFWSFIRVAITAIDDRMDSTQRPAHPIVRKQVLCSHSEQVEIRMLRSCFVLNVRTRQKSDYSCTNTNEGAESIDWTKNDIAARSWNFA